MTLPCHMSPYHFEFFLKAYKITVAAKEFAGLIVREKNNENILAIDANLRMCYNILKPS